MWGLFVSKEKKFIKEVFQYFYFFGEKAGLEEKRVTQLIPRDHFTIRQVEDARIDGLKSIDAAMIMADLCVRNSLQKKEFSKKESIKHEVVKRIKEMPLLNEHINDENLNEWMEMWVKTDIEDAAKLQFAAFEWGVRLGSLIALQEGEFRGRFDKFTKPA